MQKKFKISIANYLRGKLKIYLHSCLKIYGESTDNAFSSFITTGTINKIKKKRKKKNYIEKIGQEPIFPAVANQFIQYNHSTPCQ